MQASAEAAYNSLSKDTKPQVSGLLGWHNADDTFGIVVQGFYEDRTLRRYGQETLGYTTITAAMPIGAANPSLVGVQAPNLIGSTLFEQERKREGGDGAIQWKPNDRMELKLSGFYSKLDADNFNSNYLYWGSNELNNNVPTSFTVKNNTLVSATWPLHNAAGAVVDGIIDDNIDRAGAYSDSYYVNLDGKYRVNDQLTIKAQVGYTEGKGVTPSQPFYEVDGPVAVSYAPSGNGLGGHDARLQSRKSEWPFQRLRHQRDLYGARQGALRQGRWRLRLEQWRLQGHLVRLSRRGAYAPSRRLRPGLHPRR